MFLTEQVADATVRTKLTSVHAPHMGFYEKGACF